MKPQVAALAEQLLRTVPKADVRDLIQVLEYYNERFAEADRAKAIRYGSQQPLNPGFEKDLRESLDSFEKRAQASYIISETQVCRCCGK